MSKMILGITGTFGAGKGTVVEILKKQGFKHYSVREFLIEEIKKRNMDVNRDSMCIVANDLREKNGASYIVEKLYEKANTEVKNAVIESVRCPGEVEALKANKDFMLLAVDADQELRYKRACERNSETDKISFDKFKAQEEEEMYSEDPFKQNVSWCIKNADISILNNNTLTELENQVRERVISKLE